MMQVVKVLSVVNLVKVERQAFEEATKMQKPYYVKLTNESNEYRYYAQCPNCDNPVQLIGLYTVNAKVAPYARHYLESVDKLAPFILENYEFCHWRKNNVNQNNRRSSNNPLNKAIIRQLLTQFDKVVLFLERHTGMHFSSSLLTAYLEEYFLAKKWLFHSSGLLNLPFILVESSVSKLLNGRIISYNPELISMLEKATNKTFIDGKVPLMDEIPKLYYTFQARQVNPDTGVETMRFRIAMENNYIFDKTITLDPEYITNLFAYPRERLSINQQKRAEKLLLLAKKIAHEKGY